MDFELSDRASVTSERMWDFMHEKVFWAEPVYAAFLAEHAPH
jgi:acyl-CoA dehydrogenase